MKLPLSLLWKAKSFSPFLLASFMAPSLLAQTILINRPVSESVTPTGFYWNFDEWDQQGRVIDQGSSAINGTLTPSEHALPIAPQIVDGRFGQGVSVVPGANPATLRDAAVLGNAHGSANANALDFVQSSFTGGLWLNIDNLTDTGGHQEVYLMERGISAGSNENFISFRMVRWQGQPSNWTLRLVLGKVGATSVLLAATTTVSLPLDTWNHLGFTFDYDETASTVTFWLNGEEVGTPVSTNFTLAATIKEEERRLRVGERNVSSFASALDGRFDEAFITSGAYSFSPDAIPEPSLGALLISGGLGLWFWRRRASA